MIASAPGCQEFLEELKSRGAALGVVSGNLREIGRKKLELAGLWSYFSVSAFSEDGQTRSELARKAAERAALSEVAGTFRRISLVGDHQNDVAAAKANGFQSVAVATGIISAEELALVSPDVLLRDLTEADPAHILRVNQASRRSRAGRRGRLAKETLDLSRDLHPTVDK